MKETANQGLLETTLVCAVPLWVLVFLERPFEELLEEARAISDVIASKGDVLQFGGGKKGEAARAFNSLARGLAVLSFFPGGVRFGSLHFENVHPEESKEKTSD